MGQLLQISEMLRLEIWSLQLYRVIRYEKGSGENFHLKRRTGTIFEEPLITNKIFLSIFYWLCYYSFPNFPPLFPFCLAPLKPPAFLPFGSCSRVVYIISLTSLFHIPFLTSPYFMSTSYASFSLYLFPPTVPSPSPLKSLHFSDSVPLLGVYLVFVFIVGFFLF